MDADAETNLFRRIGHIEYLLEELTAKIDKIKGTPRHETADERFDRRLDELERMTGSGKYEE